MAEESELEILAGKVYDARALVDELYRKFETESSPKRRAAFIELEKACIARDIAENNLRKHERTLISS